MLVFVFDKFTYFYKKLNDVYYKYNIQILFTELLQVAQVFLFHCLDLSVQNFTLLYLLWASVFIKQEKTLAIKKCTLLNIWYTKLIKKCIQSQPMWIIRKFIKNIKKITFFNYYNFRQIMNKKKILNIVHSNIFFY